MVLSNHTLSGVVVAVAKCYEMHSMQVPDVTKSWNVHRAHIAGLLRACVEPRAHRSDHPAIYISNFRVPAEIAGFIFNIKMY
jgi:hypothetical protein